MDEISNYHTIRESARNLYHKTAPILSPALNEQVYFTAEGFNHIVFKGSRTEREKSTQILRFKLLSRALKLIGLSTTYQEYEETIKECDVKRYKKNVKKLRPITYWGIIAIVDGRKIKVILRKIVDNRNIHFWSIVPAWVTNKYRDARFFSTMKGRPEED
ncbi:conserved hypothetical protein [Azospirillaceae bacterium]